MLTDQKSIFACLLVISVIGLSSCMSGGQAPVYSREQQKTDPSEKKSVEQKQKSPTKISKQKIRKNYYTVVRGDTLYSIAWRYQIDYKSLAKWNGIRSPYTIFVGKKLRLIPPPKKPTQIAKVKKPKPKKAATKPTKPVVKPVQKPTKKTVPQKAAKPVPKKATAKITWVWPAKGKLITSNTASSRSGIDIKGKMGQVVKAAAAGKVVYSGSGLVGYGNLIIIKHNNSFLSAYGHNSRLLVTEETEVSRGQPIAEMGNSATNQVKLHFEIRKDGKSVDPRKYLP